MFKHYKILSIIILLLSILYACDEDNLCDQANLYSDCNAPDNLLIQDYQQASGAVTLSWNAVAGAESYILEYEAPNSTILELSTSTTSLSFNLSSTNGLHRFSIFSLCEPNECCEGQYLQGPTIFIDRNEEDCELSITNLIIEEITDSTFNLSWDLIDDASFYIVEYYEGDSPTPTSTVETDLNSIAMLYNTSTKCHRVIVKAVCGNGSIGSGSQVIIVTIDDISDFCASPDDCLKNAYCIRAKQSNNSYIHYYSPSIFCRNECNGGC